MSADEQAEADDCCQEWLSTDTETIEHGKTQAKKNRPRGRQFPEKSDFGGLTGA